MAPELRKRTRSVTGKEPVAKKAAKVEKVEKVEPATEKAPKKVTKKATKEEKVEKAPKRKAPEEAQASPVAAKKQKPVKANAKSKKSAAPAPAEPVEEEEKEKEAEPEATEDAETSVVAFEEEDDDEEVDADIAALAAGLDPEDAPAGDGTVFKSGQDVGKVPKFKKQKQLTNGKKEEPGVVFISRLPHGFYEHELKGYFSQFGNITRLRLARNKKSGASKHYAFLEFAEASTAEIVAKTMDSYLLFGHILKVKTVPADQLHEDVWKGANKRFKKIPWHKIAAGEVAKQRTESDWTHKVSKEEKKRLERAEKLKAIGYEFEAPKLKEAVAPPPEPMAVDAPEETKAIEAAPVEEKKEEEAAKEEEKVAEVETPKSAKKATPKGGKRRKSRG